MSCYQDGYHAIDDTGVCIYCNRKCKCTFAQRLVGDGCEICNSSYMEDYLLDDDDLEFMKEKDATGV